MSMPTFTMRNLLEAGMHFGHVTRRWNPKMAPYIYGVRNGIHILDLTQSAPLLAAAMLKIYEVAAGGGRILFVGTKRQTRQAMADAALRCGQYYVNDRWLGGMLTNWNTISKSIGKLDALEEKLEAPTLGLPKKERLGLERQYDKLKRTLGGIRAMGNLPDIVFVIDAHKEQIAVAEANILNIPVVGIADSNCDPDGLDYIIPGNDDAQRSITLYCDLIAGAVLAGLAKGMEYDPGESEEPLPEPEAQGPETQEPESQGPETQEPEPVVENTNAPSDTTASDGDATKDKE